MNKFSKGDKVIPMNKTYPGWDPLDKSVAWNMAKKYNQNFLYIISITDIGYVCSENLQKSGDYFMESDLIKAYTIEDLQNFPSDIWIHCTTAEQMAKLGKYYYGPEMKDYKDRLAWVNMGTLLRENGGEAGCFIGKGKYCGGWNPWSIAKDEKYTIEFSQVIFPKENDMNKKIIGYKLIQRIPNGILNETYTWNGNAYSPQISGVTYDKIMVENQPDFFEPVYESTKKTFTISCYSGGDLVITVEGNKIIAEGEMINIKNWESILSTEYKMGPGWNVKPSHYDIGCRKGVPTLELEKVINYYYSINK